jgi:hypothetical protein
MATTTYEPIYSTTLSSNQSTVSFSSFGGYTDLRIVANIKLTGTNGVYFKPNSDSSSVYSATTMYGNGSSTTSSRLTTGDLGGTGMYIPGGTFSTSNFSVLQIDFMNYTNTNVYKTALARYSTPGSRVGCSVELFAKTTAITTLEFGCDGGGSIASGSTFTLYGISNADIGAKATGGVITYDDTYFYHTFGVSGTFTPTQALTVDYLVIAGGGGGAVAHGGGGAGGLRSTVTATGGGGSLETPLSLTSGAAYTITVGAGGAGTSGASRGNGTNGVNSSIAGTGITTVTSVGGGGGGDADNAMSTGGSGGGAGYLLTSTGNNRTANQGYAGGGANPSTVTPNYPSGGGGGAGSVGQTVTSGSENGGDGGAGVSIPSIANATGTGVATYYAGGGAGGNYNNVTGGVATGGGGNAGTISSINGTNGVVNTGGGGGATISTTTSTANSGTSGSGGSGVVIVRYEK